MNRNVNPNMEGMMILAKATKYSNTINIIVRFFVFDLLDDIIESKLAFIKVFVNEINLLMS